MSNRFFELWPAVESAAPDDPTPLLVVADWCDENSEAPLAYALRWCAGHRKRPHKRPGIARHPWRWIRQQSCYASLSKKAARDLAFATLPRVVFDGMLNGHTRGWYAHWNNSRAAYKFLAGALVDLRAAVEVPTIVLPPQPEIVRGVLTCARCGVMRARSHIDCPVCKSSEVAS